ncbi:MAG: hypothetical protein V9E83_13680 [Baekduia sp.]
MSDPSANDITPCPRCGARLEPGQDWCLDCGSAARTRIATTPAWRRPLAVAGAIAALALGALGFAFADLTADNGRISDTPTTVTLPPPGVTTAPAVTTAQPDAAQPTATSPATTPTETTPPATATTAPDSGGAGALPTVPEVP